jgi:oligoribonuclease
MTNLVWIDVETTGLTHGVDVLLEVGMIVTDEWGDRRGPMKSWLINDPLYARRIKAVRSCEDDSKDAFVRDMHLKSGLWHDLAALDGFTIEEAEDDIVHWLNDHEVAGLPMVGSSVHYDRAMMNHWIPRAHDEFHYRNIDISTLKELCERLNPEIFAKFKAQESAEAAHRVLPDIIESIGEYKFYVDNFLWTA